VILVHRKFYSAQLLTSSRADDGAFEIALSVVLKTFQRLDAVVLNAGMIDPLERIADGKSLNEWKHCFDVNFFSIVHTLQLITKPLKESNRTGRVVFVSSGAATGNTAAWGAYNASKAAMNSLCR
jgi:NAD(P)-dependent dehydrogenase (short-subunit alcohol dehydrogenase family)